MQVLAHGVAFMVNHVVTALVE